jgi:hypothetical protein
VRKYTAAMALALAACAPDQGPTLASKIQPLVTLTSVVDVTQHGATAADDDAHERVAIQAAADYLCTLPPPRGLYFPLGTYTLERPPAGVVDSLRINCAMEIYGDGQGATTVAMIGTGMLPTHPNEPGAWKLIHIVGAANVGTKIYDMTVAGGLGWTVDTEEQTHLIETGQSVGTVIERVTAHLPQRPRPAGSVDCFTAPDGVMCQTPDHGGTPRLCHQYTDNTVSPPVVRVGLKGAVCKVEPSVDPQNPAPVWTLLGWYGGGDCFRFFSEPSVPARDVTVRNVNGVNCDRSCISGQRGIDGLTIEDSACRTDNDTPFDFEATGGGGLKDVTVRGLSLSRGETGGGGFTVTFTGNGDNGLTNGVYDCGNPRLEGEPDIDKGGVGVLDVDQVEFVNCIINSGVLSEAATFDVRKRARKVIVRNSKIVRPPGASPLPVINVTHHTGVAPRLLVLTDVVLEQHTVAPIINIVSLHSLQMTRVHMVYAAPAWSPPTNGHETALIIADTTLGSPQRVDSLSLNEVTLEAPQGAVATLIRQGQTGAWTATRQVSLNNVTVPAGALRNGLVRFNGTSPSRLYMTRVTKDASLPACVGTCSN